MQFRLWVGVGSLLSAESSDDVDEATVVLNATSGAARLLLFLLLLLHLRRLSLDFTGTGEGAVDLTSEKTASHLHRAQLGESAGSQGFALNERSTIERKDLVLNILDALHGAHLRLQPLDRRRSRRPP